MQLNRENLESTSVKNLRAIARRMDALPGVWVSGASKADLIEAILSGAVSAPFQPALPTMEGVTEAARAELSSAKREHELEEDAAAIAGILARARGILDVNAVTAIVREEIAKAAPVRVRHIIVENKVERELPEGVLVPDYFDWLLALGKLRKNTYIWGAPGSGKTHTVKLAADALGLRFDCLSVTAGLSETQIAGRMLPTDSGSWDYIPSGFVDFYENGGVFLFDELDSGDSNTLNLINSALANGHFSIPSRPGKPAIKHPDCWIVGAGNTAMSGGTRAFSGRMVQDAALKDRFQANMIHADYQPSIEQAILDAEVYAWGLKAREAIHKAGLEGVFCTTRFLRDVTDMRAAGCKEYLSELNWFSRLTEGWGGDNSEKLRMALR